MTLCSCFRSLQHFVSISGPVLNQMGMERGTYQVREIAMLHQSQLVTIYYTSIVFQILMPAAMVQ